MPYIEAIQAARNDPRRLEDLYQTACQDNSQGEFSADLEACFRQSPENLLYAAWHYRLARSAPAQEPAERSINWRLAVPLSVALGLLYWFFAGARFDFPNGMPYLMIAWAPVGAGFVIAFLTLTANERKAPAGVTIATLLLLGAYVTLFVASGERRHYRDLMALHLPLAAWAAAGVSVLYARADHRNRFGFLIKSIEVFITGGLYLMAGGAFVAITVGMFDALNINFSD
jgi:hypothetical protein